MNITLKEVYQTNPDGDQFWKLKEYYIQGSTVHSFSFLLNRYAYIGLLGAADKIYLYTGESVRHGEG